MQLNLLIFLPNSNLLNEIEIDMCFCLVMSWPFQCWGYFLPKDKDAKIFEKPPKPFHVWIHSAFTENSQMTHVPGFSHLFGFLRHFFLLATSATRSIYVKPSEYLLISNLPNGIPMDVVFWHWCCTLVTSCCIDISTLYSIPFLAHDVSSAL